MFDLLDDGSIAIDFQPEEGDPLRVTVSAPPSFGAYKRVRGKVEEINRRRDEYATELRNDDKVGAAEMQTLLASFTEDSAVEWWRWVMVGDDSYKGRADTAPPEDVDSWPAYLTANDAITAALTHWKTVPLARGGQR